MKNKGERNFIGNSVASVNIMKFILAIFIMLFSSTAFVTYASNDELKLTETTINAYFLLNHHVMGAIKSTYKNEEEMNKDKNFAKLDVMCGTLLGFKDKLLVELKAVETSSGSYRIKFVRRFYRIITDFQKMKRIFESALKVFARRRLTGSLKTFIGEAFRFYNKYFLDFVATLKADLKSSKQ